MRKKTLPSDGEPASGRTETFGLELRLVDKEALARATSLSCRTLENLMARRVIPYVRLSARCVRFHVPAVIAALRKFELKEASRVRAA